MAFPGGVLVGCDAGTLNSVKIKGNHTAMKAACWPPGIMSALTRRLQPFCRLLGSAQTVLPRKELHSSRNFSGFAQIRHAAGRGDGLDRQNPFAGRMPLHTAKPDYACLDDAAAKPISYPKPDNQITFDRLIPSCQPTTKRISLSPDAKRQCDPN